MRYTYKNECIIHDMDDVQGVIFVLLWLCATLAVFLMDAYIIIFKGSDGIGSPVLGGMFAVVTVAAAVCVYRSIAKRRKRALEHRNKALEIGERCEGRIVDAGMKKETVKHERYDNENNRSETFFRTERNYWVAVEYFSPRTQEKKVFRAEHMRRSLAHHIGCAVDVYVWYEWCDLIQKDLSQTYIDTGRLG